MKAPPTGHILLIKFLGRPNTRGGSEKEIMKNLADKALTMGGAVGVPPRVLVLGPKILQAGGGAGGGAATSGWCIVDAGVGKFLDS